MNRISGKRLVMLLLLAATALLAAIHQVVVGNVNLIAAVATAMPDHKALCVSLFRRVLRSQPAETSAGNVSGSIVLYTFAAAMGLAPGHQFCRRGFAGIAADAQACPVCAHLGALPAASDHFQLPKGLTKQVVCRCLSRPFHAQAAATLGAAMQ